MSITGVLLNVTDIGRSVDFYRNHLGARLVDRPSGSRALLDVVTATIELNRVGEDGPASTWEADDLQCGFRHIGFKVASVDPVATGLRADGVVLHLGPLDAEGAVRIAFFPDPDGTVLEVVEGDVRYSEVLDPAGVAAERSVGPPGRPRLDHVAVTVDDQDRALGRYRQLGFTPIGRLDQPADARGLQIAYARSGETVLELFSFREPTRSRPARLDRPGFVAVALRPNGSPAGVRIGELAGHTVSADPDDLATSGV